MLWTEKYSPKNFNEFIGNLKAKKEVIEWAEQWLIGNLQKCLLIVGPPGTGKTTFAHLTAKEFSDFVELNASDKRSYDIIKRIVGEASASRSLFHDGMKLIILDEVDGLHGTDDRGGIKAINEIVKKTHHPIIMTANDPYSKRITSLKRNCKVIKIRKVHTNSIVAFLKRICVNEGIEFEEHVIKTLAKRSNGDLRSAIGDLQVIAQGKDQISSADLDIVSQKDQVSNVFDSVRTVLKSKNFAKIKDSMRLDVNPPFILETIVENIPHEYEKAEEIERAYEMVSLADINFGRAFSTRNYTYWKYSFDFMSLGVGLAKDETYKKFARYRGSSVYAMLSKSRSKRALMDIIAQKIGNRLHLSKRGAIAQFPYLKIMFTDDDMAYELVNYFGFENKEVKFFRSKKLKKLKKPSKSVRKQSRSVKKPSETNFTSKKAQKVMKKDKTTKTAPKKPKILSKKPKKDKTNEKSENKGSKSKKKDKVEKQTSLFHF
ncbi:MAG: replication factor C large subunit [Euryarchaeota archaeon]|nr:replication factor C large subunit [Euryarchaeota archaeon]